MGNTASESGDKVAPASPGREGGRFSIKELVKADTLRDARAWLKGNAPGCFRRLLCKRHPWIPVVAGLPVFVTLALWIGSTSAQNARYLLSAEAQVLAAILGLSGAAVLVVAQMTASAYSLRVARSLFDKWIRIGLGAYAFVIVVSLLLISFLPGNGLGWFLRLAVGADFLLGAGCVGGVALFVGHVTNLLRAGSLLTRIQGKAERTWARPRADVAGVKTAQLPARFQASFDLAVGALTRSDFATASNGLHVAATICQERVSRLEPHDKYEPLDEMARSMCYLAKRLEDVGGPPDSMQEVLDELWRINGLLGDCGHDNRPLLTPIMDLHGTAASARLKRSVFWFFMQTIVPPLRRMAGNERVLLNSCMAALCLAKLRVNWADKPVDWVNEPHLYLEHERQMGNLTAIKKEFNRFMYAAGVFYRRNRTPERPGRTRTSLPYAGEEQDFARRYEELSTRFHGWEDIEEGVGEAVLSALKNPGSPMTGFVRGWAIGFLPCDLLTDQFVYELSVKERSEFFLLRFAERLHALERDAKQQNLGKRWEDLRNRVWSKIHTDEGKKCYKALMSR